MAPRWCQDGPKISQGSPKTIQDGPKMAQDGAKMGANRGPKSTQDRSFASDLLSDSRGPVLEAFWEIGGTILEPFWNDLGIIQGQKNILKVDENIAKEQKNKLRSSLS